MSIESSHILDPLMDGNLSPANLRAANQYYGGAEPAELVDAVAGMKPWALSSFGFQAATLFHTVERAGHNFPAVFIDTGFEHPATHQYVDTLSRYFALNVTVVEAIPGRVQEAAEQDYYHTNQALFNEITKHEPLERFIMNSGVRILLGGLRRAQGEGSEAVAIRSHAKRFQRGPQGELRINPNVDMTDAQVREIFAAGVPKHPLRDEYLGDRLPLTVADQKVPKPDCTINWDLRPGEYVS